MKPLPLLILFLACTACANFPELEGSEPPSLKSARYPKLIPLDGDLDTPINPVFETATLEQDLLTRREALQKKADQLQQEEIN